MSRLKHILIKTKQKVFSSILGDNSSIFQGEGYDFVELKEYQNGDDVKKIDWTITAKLNKPYIKVFKQTRELNIVIATILDGSVYFGQNRFKQDLIAEISAILGYSSIKQNDRFTHLIFSDKLDHYQKPSKRNFAISEMVKNILEFKPLNLEKNFKIICDKIFKIVNEKSIIFIISDFIDENIDLRVLSKKHEIIAIIVRDKFEENPENIGDITLIDPSNKNINIDSSLSKKAIKNYKNRLEDIDKKLLKQLKKSNIRHIKIYTDEEPLLKLLKL